MKYFPYILFAGFLLYLVFSCQTGEKHTQTAAGVKISDSIKPKTKIRYTIHSRLSPEAAEKLKTEKNLEELTLMLRDLSASTTGEFLIESGDIVRLVKKLRDSSEIRLIARPDVRTYLNILWNESLALSQINHSGITSDMKIKRKISSLLAAYEMFIEKLNTAYQLKKWEEQLNSDKDIQKAFSGFKIDTLSEQHSQRNKKRSPQLPNMKFPVKNPRHR